ncbi:MAG: stage III sporulation protein AD [Oscillospiraceae bacterium]|nr:stage III sporulation protein AD [Oscillospiraceae bacterium]
MDIFKVIGVGLVGGVLSMTVRQYKKEYAVLVGLATVIVILFFTLDTLETAIDRILVITEKSGVDARYFTAVMKVVGVAYITQFGAEILRDGGENAIALKVELAGKVFILGLTLPIVTEFLEVCVNALSAV